MRLRNWLAFLFTWAVWLLRNDCGAVFKDLVERLMALPPSAEIKVRVVCRQCHKALTCPETG